MEKEKYNARKEYLKNYYLINKQLIKENSKKYYDKNSDIILKKQKIHRSKNETKIIRKKYSKNYTEKNKDILNAKSRIKKKYKRQNDPLYKLITYVRSMTLKAIKTNGYTKKSKTFELIGLTKEEFYTYIESKFESWMNWNNRGDWNGIPTEINTAWDVDHIIPISSAKTEEELIKLCHYTNLQPLCSYTNRNIKRAKLDF